MKQSWVGSVKYSAVGSILRLRFKGRFLRSPSRLSVRVKQDLPMYNEGNTLALRY